MELGKQIKKYRTETKMSQEELANRVYVSRQTISNWETGKSMPDLSLMQILCEELGVSMQELLSGKRLDDTEKKSDPVRLVLELAEREKQQKTKKINTCFVIGLLCLGTVIFYRQFGVPVCLPETAVIFLTGLGMLFEASGFYLNCKSRKYTPGEIKILSSTEAYENMKTAGEMLQFARRNQKAELKQYEKAFEAIEKELEDEEQVLFAMVGNNCTFNDSPGPWQPVIAVTKKRLLLSGEGIKGRMMTFYGVDSFLFDEIKGVDAGGNVLTIKTDRDVIKISGEGIAEMAGGVKEVWEKHAMVKS